MKGITESQKEIIINEKMRKNDVKKLSDSM